MHDTHTSSVASGLDRLRTSTGGFAMVALDQRESLREMFPRRDGALVDDETLRAFKSDAARLLSPLASGVLLDYPLGVVEPIPPAHLDDECGLLLAADDLHSVEGAGVVSSTLDRAVDVDLIHATGAAGIKYLVIWRRGDRSFVPELEAFLALARAAGVASFVEGIVRPPAEQTWRSPEDRHDAIVEAAADLSVGADVYKAEVPGYLPGDPSAIAEQSALVSAAVGGPWVVLSNGVERDDFADAVEASCSGGAWGFLAGRAIWADTVPESDPIAALESRSVARLKRLTEIVRTTDDRRSAPSLAGA